MTTVAEHLIGSLADLGVTQVWGVVGDALNPVTDAIRREERIEWIGVRHEEVAAFAASAQAQLTGTLGVCMGTVGPGSIHLLNGLYDAAKSRAPVLAVCGQVPLAELGSGYFQEVDNDLLFTDVASFRHTVTSTSQLPRVLEQAVNAAYAAPGVAVLTLPGDIGGLELPDDVGHSRFVTARPVSAASADDVAAAIELLSGAQAVTVLAGIGAREARVELLTLAERLKAPIVLSLKAKEGLERDNPYQVGQSGLIGNPASKVAFDGCDVLLMVGTDFPYPEWLPAGARKIQIDRNGATIGRRSPVEIGLVGDAKATLAHIVAGTAAREDGTHLNKARKAYETWCAAQQRLTDPHHDRSLVGRVRSTFDNSAHRIRPEVLAAAVDRHAAQNAIFTTDTGMSTVWLSRFVTLGGSRRLLGSYNLGSMANAVPQALGAQALDRSRQVIAFAGDGGLSMLLGDLITAVTANLPVKIVVFDNGRLGMVKLEQEQAGLPEFGTVLTNPDFAVVAQALGLRGLRVEKADDVDDAIRAALDEPGPVLVDVLTNPEEIALPPKPTVGQAWGFAIAKLKETVVSPE